MIGITFPGTDEDARIVQAVREARGVGEIADEYGLDPETVVGLYQDYLRHRQGVLDNPDAASEVQQGYLDRLDALVETYSRPAAQGDVQAARFILAAVNTIAALQEKFARIDAIRRIRSPAQTDAQKREGSDRDRMVREYHELVRMCSELDIPVPEDAVRAYRAALATDYRHETESGKK